MLYWRVPVQGQ